jgi:hypothetical protein
MARVKLLQVRCLLFIYATVIGVRDLGPGVRPPFP